jgi:CzcA family heavy metal efflux pump
MNQFAGRFAIRHGSSITFLVVAAALAGAFAAAHMPSSVFPQTDFPRVIIMVENGVMPADEMMALITRPVEESMKDLQGCQSVRSSTGQGTAEVDLFFSWDVDMHQAELQTQARLSQIRARLPATATTDVFRMNFSTFPIIGLSLTGPAPDATVAWEQAQYRIKPQFLQIPGVSRVDLLGGREPEYQVVVDPARLAAVGLDLASVVNALASNNLAVPGGMHQQDQRMYLTVVDGRLHGSTDIENLTVPGPGNRPIPIRDFAAVHRGPSPALTVVTADGTDAVLFNIYSHPDASTLDVSARLSQILPDIRAQLPAGMKLNFFYDQSLIVRGSVRSVWDAIAFGLILSVLILYLFLKNWPMTLVATLIIPITVLVTILAMRLIGLSFNLMTLGGIAAAIGLVIDDAIVVVEAIHSRLAAGLDRAATIEEAIGEILPPLIGSTLTPVVVFIPLAFLTGIAGVFFRSLAITMAVALLMSLVLAVTLTPSLAAWVIGRLRPESRGPGIVLSSIIQLYERVVRRALAWRWTALGIAIFILLAAATGYTRLKTDFLPKMDEGGFIIDYVSPPGTSLDETDRQMRQAERIVASIPEIEGYSRRTGTALGVHLDEPNTGDFLVKLRPDRHRSSDAIIADLRHQLTVALPRINWEFPGILTDLIGDLTWEDQPIEVKIMSNDEATLVDRAKKVEEEIEDIPGLVDVFNGLVYTGPSIHLSVRFAEAQRLGLTAADIGQAVNIAMLGQVASTVVQADRVIDIRVKADPAAVDRLDKLGQLPIRTRDGHVVRLDEVTDLVPGPSRLELHRDNLRQDIAVTAGLQGRDLGSAMKQIQYVLNQTLPLPPGSIEFGGLFEQQQESFRNLTVVLLTALVLVFTVALLEFRSFREPIAVVSGAALSTFGIVAALLITGTTLNIVTFLGAIIGMGIVHKNGLLMLDAVKQLQAGGMPLSEALVHAGRRRLRPVLMTSLAAGLGMLPLAWGFGSADMLRPMAVAVIGAVCVAVLLSLVATPVIYYLLAPAEAA